MTYAIRVIGAQMPEGWMNVPESGRYLMDFDVAVHPGHGSFPSTPSIRRAKHFANAGDATKFWQTQSLVVPLRTDGLPNRPLTAYTIEIVPTDEIEAI